MKKNPWVVAITLVGVFMVLMFIGICAAMYTAFGEKTAVVSSNSVLILDVKGIIIDSRQFIKTLHKYREDEDVKAIVIRLDSPGGVVGPSQEIYDEILRTREMGKHVVASLGSVAASGAYYIAVACEKIVTNPGTITGSIGVIMEFANLSRLYDWAKIERYVVKSGSFKDIGNEYRSMTPPERAVIQDMIDNVHNQFRQAVVKGRKMKVEEVNKFADGRIFSGEQAVKVGMADSLGGLHEAVELAGKLAGIKGKPEMVFPPPKRPKFIDMFFGQDDEDEMYGKVLRKSLGLDLIGQPLYLMPGAR
ncbi:MAG: signal peptide peptidase SppA [Oligoflexia bacterium]|nr:signal peptide peptidase SppA [Oligoflexia bacterium]